MRQYSIKDLERLSGVKAGTIRIWEQRYDLLEPIRTETNIRHYKDSDLKKLLNVSMLLEQGMRISKISEFSDSELKLTIATLLEQGESISAQTEFYIQALVVSRLELDEARFNNLFSRAVNEKGFLNAITDFIYPFLVKVGMMWGMDEVNPGQEHFVSCLIRQKILTGINDLPISAPTKNGYSYVLFLPEGELHEIGLILANYILRSHGYKVVYLGQDVPLADIQQVVDASDTTHLLTIFTASRTPLEYHQLLTSYDEAFPDIRIVYSGLDYYLNKIDWNPGSNVKIINGASEFIDYLNKLPI